MDGDLLYTITAIILDCFTAFGLLTFLQLFLLIFVKKETLMPIDKKATIFVSFVGVFYLLVWIVLVFTTYSFSEDSKTFVNQRGMACYWLEFWFQPLLWFIITQLLRWKHIRKNIAVRLFFAFLLVVSIKRLIILVTALHRDYLPSSWMLFDELHFYPSNFILSNLMKIIVFLIFVGLFHFAKEKFDTFRVR